MQFFVTHKLQCLDALKAIRPPRVPPRVLEQVLQTLPAQGELQPTADEERKLQAIDAVLAAHDRSGAVVVKEIDIVQAAVALYARCVLLISRPALKQLTSSEVQALAAHEIGHDYFWNEYETASRNNDEELFHEIEMRCDAIAILTLIALDIDPDTLASAVSKIELFNARFGAPLNSAHYPPFRERSRFQEAFIRFAAPGCGRDGESRPRL
jgi:hypothetical protein